MLKSRFFFLLAAVFMAIGGYFLAKHYQQPTQEPDPPAKKESTELVGGSGFLRSGDIIFNTSRTGQSQLIQIATNTKYSHCGIIFQLGDKYYVFEAVQPVSLTPLARWMLRGKGGHFLVKRLKNAPHVLTPEVLNKMREVGRSFQDSEYDLYFGWSDDKLYSSELVWKIYQRATGIELASPQKLKDLNIEAPAVQVRLKERYGNNIPYEEPVITPAQLVASDQLITVVEK